MSKNVSCDTSTLINFLKINRVDLLQRCSYSFYITDHVQEEITVNYSGQRALLETALDKTVLKKIDFETPEEFALLAKLHESKQLGAGECAAIAIAAHRGYHLAIDDKQAIKKASSLIPPNSIFRTQDLVLLLIQEHLLEIEEADLLIELWSKKHRFHMDIKSFNEIIPFQLRIE